MRVLIGGALPQPTPELPLLTGLQLQILRSRVQKFLITDTTRENKRQSLLALQDWAERRIQQRGYLALLEILRRLPSTNAPFSHNADFQLDGSIQQFVELVTSNSLAQLIERRNYCPRGQESRVDLFDRLFGVPASSAGRVSIYDAHAAANLRKKNWADTGTAWFVRKLLGSSLDSITIITEFPYAGPSARNDKIPTSHDLKKSRHWLTHNARELLGEVRNTAPRQRPPRLEFIFIDERVHDRCIRFDDIGAESGCAAVLGKGLESFQDENLSNSAIAPFDWEAARTWTKPQTNAMFKPLAI